MMTAIELFERCIPEPNSGCWLWEGVISPNGYGQISKYGPPTQTFYAHRLSWQAHHGAIPDKMFVCHHCDVRSYINPDHLFVGTARDNLVDMYNKGRGNPLRGEAHHAARFSEAAIESIRADPRGPSAISKDYGCDRQYIWRIKNNQIWKNED